MTESLPEREPVSGSAGNGGGDVAADASERFLAYAERAQRLLNEGRLGDARDVFLSALSACGEEASYRRAVALERVGFCYLMEGQPMVAAGFLQQASEATEKTEPSDAVSALQGVIQSELGQVFSASGNLEQARQAFTAAIEIARSVDDARALAIDLDHLGALALREGKPSEGRAYLTEALKAFEAMGQPGAQAVARHHLGLAAEQLREWDEAEEHYVTAARMLTDLNDYESAARLYAQAAGACEKADRMEAAEAWYRKTLEHSRLGTDPRGLRHHLSSLARLLQGKPGGLDEARELVEEALAAGEKSLDAQIWELYGQLADVIEMQAKASEDPTVAQAHAAAVGTYRHIQHFAPRLLATLQQLGEEPSFAAAVILERIGRCCLIGGRPAPAVVLYRQAVAALDTLGESEPAKALRGVLQSALGDAHRLAGFPAEARKGYAAALDIARELKDLRGELAELTHLGAFALADGKPETAADHLRAAASLARDLGEEEVLLGLTRQIEALGAAQKEDDSGAAAVEDPSAPFEARVLEDITTECAFDTDLLIEVRRMTRLSPLDISASEPLADEARPTLVPMARTALDASGLLRIYVPAGEPTLRQEDDCVIIQSVRREIAIGGRLDAVWTLVRLADGNRRVGEILSKVPEADRGAAERLLSALAAAGAFDVSGRPIARFIHAATKKGTLAGGGLEGESVLQLATDGNYRAYPEAARVAVADEVSEPIRGFHTLTRSRRSRRVFTGEEMSRADFDALLHTACGLTGAATWSGRGVGLRAYPSSGALYAVEIYPVVFAVAGLEPGIYHFVPGDGALEAIAVGDAFDGDGMIEACLPIERPMVSGAAAMICLAGNFRRHERKYGEGGYRMLVAEAGHISQNLVLSATALGASARPFGGVFDALINRRLGLDDDEEQFLLSVLVGQAGEEGTDASPLEGVT